MADGVTLRTAHPIADAVVRAWLDEARLVLPRGLTLTVDVAEVGDPPDDDRPVFKTGRVFVRAGGGDDVSLEWGPGLGRARIAAGSTEARVVVTEDALVRKNELLRSFLLTVCILLLRRAGLHHVHAATLRDPSDRGWMLVGMSGSGKSTTTALLGKQGWEVGTDDIAFLSAGAAPARAGVVAWREQLALRDDAVIATGQSGGTHFAQRRKTGWFPEEISAAWVRRVEPEFLLFPSVGPDAETRVTPIRSGDALKRLFRCSPWVALEPELADEHLDLMTRLIAQTRSFEVTLGRDMFETPGLLLQLVA